jgi:hypothetical protein
VRKFGYNDDVGSECLFLSFWVFPSTHESSDIYSMETIYSSTYDVNISIWPSSTHISLLHFFKSDSDSHEEEESDLHRRKM